MMYLLNARPSVFVLFFAFLLVPLQTALGQEPLPPEVLGRLAEEDASRLDAEGHPLEVSPDGSFVPGELIVRFKKGIINLPSGKTNVQLEGRRTAIEQIVTRVPVQSLSVETRVQALRKVFPEAEAGDTLRTLPSGRRVAVPDLSQVFVLSVPDQADVRSLVSRFEALEDVLYAEPNHQYELAVSTIPPPSLPEGLREMIPVPLATSVPNDPRYPEQWSLEQSTDENIDAEGAWAIHKSTSNVDIAIIDTGVDYNNKDLGGGFGTKVVDGYDYESQDSDPRDENFHGTHVAGIAGALTNNFNSSGQREGIAGVAGGWGYDAASNTGNKGADLVAIKIFDANGNPASTDDIADAIRDAADPNVFGAEVLNNSWGGGPYSETIRGAVNFAAVMNRVFAAAKGNDDTDARHYPSDYDSNWIISVGATDRNGERATGEDPGWLDGSNYGNGMDVVAPGTAILSTMPTTTTSVMSQEGWPTNYAGTESFSDGTPISGTSMATPHVSGLAALLISEASSQGRTLHPQDVEGLVRATAEETAPDNTPGYDDFFGAGRINAQKALERLQSPYEIKRWTASGGSSTGNTDVFKMGVIDPGGGPLASGTYNVKRYTVEQTVFFPESFTETPDVWCRGVDETTGWSAAAPNYQTGYCRPLSATTTSATLRTYVYEVWNLTGQYLGWYPTSPSNVEYAYSASGVPDTPDLPPAAPSNLVMTNAGQVNQNPQLDWDDNTEPDLDHYTVYRCASHFQTCTWTAIGTPTSSSFTDFGVMITGSGSGDDEYRYYVSATDTGGQESSSSNTVSTWGTTPMLRGPTDTEDPAVPEVFALDASYPNPVRTQAMIRYALPEATGVTLTVYDVLGREVARLVDRSMPIGFHEVQYDTSDLPSGTYLYRLRAGAFTQTKRMVIIR